MIMSENKTCPKCGKPLTRSYDGLCQGCYNYYRNGGTDNPLPPEGIIAYDYRGYVICHICGKAYKRLGSHIRESHSMTIAAYKELYNLCNSAKTTEAKYSQHMHDLAYENKMPERLIATGMSTRIKKGENDKRLGKPVRLQEIYQMRSRTQK